MRMRRWAMGLVVAAGAILVSGCARGGADLFERAGDHFEWHVYGTYQETVKLHQDFDRIFLNMDERNPDRYP